MSLDFSNNHPCLDGHFMCHSNGLQVVDIPSYETTIGKPPHSLMDELFDVIFSSMTSDDYLKTYTPPCISAVKSHNRSNIIAWMCEAISVLGWSSRTFFASVDLFERTINNAHCDDANYLKRRAISSVRLAVSMHECYDTFQKESLEELNKSAGVLAEEAMKTDTEVFQELKGLIPSKSIIEFLEIAFERLNSYPPLHRMRDKMDSIKINQILPFLINKENDSNTPNMSGLYPDECSQCGVTGLKNDWFASTLLSTSPHLIKTAQSIQQRNLNNTQNKSDHRNFYNSAVKNKIKNILHEGKQPQNQLTPSTTAPSSTAQTTRNSPIVNAVSLLVSSSSSSPSPKQHSFSMNTTSTQCYNNNINNNCLKKSLNKHTNLNECPATNTPLQIIQMAIDVPPSSGLQEQFQHNRLLHMGNAEYEFSISNESKAEVDENNNTIKLLMNAGSNDGNSVNISPNEYIIGACGDAQSKRAKEQPFLVMQGEYDVDDETLYESQEKSFSILFRLTNSSASINDLHNKNQLHKNIDGDNIEANRNFKSGENHIAFPSNLDSSDIDSSSFIDLEQKTGTKNVYEQPSKVAIDFQSNMINIPSYQSQLIDVSSSLKNENEVEAINSNPMLYNCRKKSISYKHYCAHCKDSNLNNQCSNKIHLPVNLSMPNELSNIIDNYVSIEQSSNINIDSILPHEEKLITKPINNHFLRDNIYLFDKTASNFVSQSPSSPVYQNLSTKPIEIINDTSTNFICNRQDVISQTKPKNKTVQTVCCESRRQISFPATSSSSNISHSFMNGDISKEQISLKKDNTHNNIQVPIQPQIPHTTAFSSYSIANGATFQLNNNISCKENDIKSNVTFSGTENNQNDSFLSSHASESEVNIRDEIDEKEECGSASLSRVKVEENDYDLSVDNDNFAHRSCFFNGNNQRGIGRTTFDCDDGEFNKASISSNPSYIQNSYSKPHLKSQSFSREASTTTKDKAQSTTNVKICSCTNASHKIEIAPESLSSLTYLTSTPYQRHHHHPSISPSASFYSPPSPPPLTPRYGSLSAQMFTSYDVHCLRESTSLHEAWAPVESPIKSSYGRDVVSEKRCVRFPNNPFLVERMLQNDTRFRLFALSITLAVQSTLHERHEFARVSSPVAAAVVITRAISYICEDLNIAAQIAEVMTLVSSETILRTVHELTPPHVQNAAVAAHIASLRSFAGSVTACETDKHSQIAEVFSSHTMGGISVSKRCLCPPSREGLTCDESATRALRQYRTTADGQNGIETNSSAIGKSDSIITAIRTFPLYYYPVGVQSLVTRRHGSFAQHHHQRHAQQQSEQSFLSMSVPSQSNRGAVAEVLSSSMNATTSIPESVANQSQSSSSMYNYHHSYSNHLNFQENKICLSNSNILMNTSCNGSNYMQQRSQSHTHVEYSQNQRKYFNCSSSLHLNFDSSHNHFSSHKQYNNQSQIHHSLNNYYTHQQHNVHDQSYESMISESNSVGKILHD